MKQVPYKSNALKVGICFGLFTFAALSVCAGGMIEFSMNVGFLRWVLDVTAYAFTNKLLEKLIAAVAIGCLTGFAANMVAYGKAIKERRVHRTTRIHFTEAEGEDASRIA